MVIWFEYLYRKKKEEEGRKAVRKKNTRRQVSIGTSRLFLFHSGNNSCHYKSSGYVYVLFGARNRILYIFVENKYKTRP